MKVFLKADVRNVGAAGTIVEVADGYARNFLLARGLAVPADRNAEAQAKNKQSAEAFKKSVELAEANKLKEKLETLHLVFTATSGADGKLYGSITAAHIADELLQKEHIELDKRKIELSSPIRATGDYELIVRLAQGVTAKLKLTVKEE